MKNLFTNEATLASALRTGGWAILTATRVRNHQPTKPKNPMIRLNYAPEIRSLLCRLETAGFRVLSAATNGDQIIFDPEDKPSFVAELAAADDATVRLASPQSNRVFWVYLTTGDEPGELVADSHCPAASHQEEITLFRSVIAAHADFWCEQDQAVCAERD